MTLSTRRRPGGTITFLTALTLASSIGAIGLGNPGHAAPKPSRTATPASTQQGASVLTVQTGSDIPAHVTFPTDGRD